jgi:hypothetical protein
MITLEPVYRQYPGAHPVDGTVSVGEVRRTPPLRIFVSLRYAMDSPHCT